MANNLQNASVNLMSDEFNNASKENGINCSDLDSHLNFESLATFSSSIEDLNKLSPTLTAYASCGS